MNIDIIIKAGYDTPDLLTGFLMLDTAEQDAIYHAAARKLEKGLCVCSLPEKHGFAHNVRGKSPAAGII